MTRERFAAFRWAKVNERRRVHLWLGDATACGLTIESRGGDVHRVESAYPKPACKPCWAYLQGWLDRHDYGPAPALTDPNPLAADSGRALVRGGAA